LNCKRLRPPSCGGGELKGAEDEEEALLTARVAAYWHSPEGLGLARLLELEMKGFGGCRSVAEQKELDQLKVVYPVGPTDTPYTEAIDLKLAELRQRSK
jgi:hypothetical protein